MKKINYKEIFTDKTKLKNTIIMIGIIIFLVAFSIYILDKQGIINTEEKTKKTSTVSTNNITKDNTIKKNFAKNILKEGDYIEYVIPERNFEITAEKSGAEENQSYNTSSYIGTWQVLYNNSAYGLQIVSSKKVGNLILKGINGYNNSIDILNEISDYYINDDYAISARSIGTNPKSPQDISGYQDFSQMSYSSRDLDARNYYIDYTRYNGLYKSVTSDDYEIDRNQLIALRIGPDEIDDWLASRFILNSGRLTLNIRTDNRLLTVLEKNNYWAYETMIRINCQSYYKQLYSTPTEVAYDTEPTYEFSEETTGGERGVKPVITLKDDLVIVSGNGTMENPYKIENKE